MEEVVSLERLPRKERWYPSSTIDSIVDWKDHARRNNNNNVCRKRRKEPTAEQCQSVLQTAPVRQTSSQRTRRSRDESTQLAYQVQNQRWSNQHVCLVILLQTEGTKCPLVCFDFMIATFGHRDHTAESRLLLRNSSRKQNHMPASFGG